jgi:hypothetical protein
MKHIVAMLILAALTWVGLALANAANSGAIQIARGAALAAPAGVVQVAPIVAIVGFGALMLLVFLVGGLQNAEHNRKHAAITWMLAGLTVSIIAVLTGKP